MSFYDLPLAGPAFPFRNDLNSVFLPPAIKTTVPGFRRDLPPASRAGLHGIPCRGLVVADRAPAVIPLKTNATPDAIVHPVTACLHTEMLLLIFEIVFCSSCTGLSALSALLDPKRMH